MEAVEVAGLRIAFERTGDGPPLVLLHGLPGDSRIWKRQLDGLADDYAVVAWDAPGCGRSSAPSDDFGIRDVARYLIGFIQKLDLQRPHVLGMSWGSDPRVLTTRLRISSACARPGTRTIRYR